MATPELLEVKIARRLDEAEGIVSLELVSVSGTGLPAFEAGSHVDIHIAPGIIRQYSLCNDPRETHRYLFGILREPQSRGGSSAIHEGFSEGRTLRISQPRNNFKLKENARHSILAGGGIGITPILCMAWRLQTLGASFELHYCARSLERAAFMNTLKAVPFADAVFLHLDDGPDSQRFAVDRYLAKPDPGTQLYTCGPGGFMEYVISGAKRFGWDDGHVHVEYFSASVDTTGAAFTVRAARSGLSLTIPADKTIAEVLLANHVEVPLSCEQGVCGTCLTRVLEGLPDHRDGYQTDEEKAANNQMTLCCSRARTAVIVLDI
ncbi:PDR/VanB family oxidoreductase [Paraburkholderia sediminicola]|uniref:PDR/VanB family oxidoreductase n=1 Tax=Paraburkholderia sediminicola TaxID=458836 RepID=UPI0038BAF4CC